MASRNPHALGPTHPRSTPSCGYFSKTKDRDPDRTAYRHSSQLQSPFRHCLDLIVPTIRIRSELDNTRKSAWPVTNQFTRPALIDNDRRIVRRTLCGNMLCFQPGTNFQCPYCTAAHFRPHVAQAYARWDQVFRSRQYNRYKRSVVRRIGPNSPAAVRPNWRDLPCT